MSEPRDRDPADERDPLLGSSLAEQSASEFLGAFDDPAAAPPRADSEPLSEGQVADGRDGPDGTTRLPEHDPTGLELARTVARSVGAQTRRRRRNRPQRSTAPTLSSPGPDDRDPTVLSAAVDRLMDAKGWTTEINVHTLLARWAVLVGAVNAAHSRPESYADGVLTVRTESTVWATSLRTIAAQLVARLNDQLGDGTVTRVKVLGPAAPSWKKGPRSVRDGRGPRDTYG